MAHRDYLVSAPIRLFIFDNRIEIVSPGHLPNNLTVEKIRTGNSNIRNPILVSCIAKGLLPYHGLGSGIKRALEKWPEIDFTDDRDGCLFTATVHRKTDAELPSAEPSEKRRESVGKDGKDRRESVGETARKILVALGGNSSMTIPELSKQVGVTERSIQRNIQNLQDAGLLRRVGGRKAGHWEVIE